MKNKTKNELADASITAIGLLLSEYLADNCQILINKYFYVFEYKNYKDRRLSLGRQKRWPSRRPLEKFFACRRG